MQNVTRSYLIDTFVLSTGGDICKHIRWLGQYSSRHFDKDSSYTHQYLLKKEWTRYKRKILQIKKKIGT